MSSSRRPIPVTAITARDPILNYEWRTETSDMGRQMEITAEDSFLAIGERKDADAPVFQHAARDGELAGQRARAAMACYESYIAEYRAWARNLRRPTD